MLRLLLLVLYCPCLCFFCSCSCFFMCLCFVALPCAVSTAFGSQSFLGLHYSACCSVARVLVLVLPDPSFAFIKLHVAPFHLCLCCFSLPLVLNSPSLCFVCFACTCFFCSCSCFISMCLCFVALLYKSFCLCLCFLIRL